MYSNLMASIGFPTKLLLGIILLLIWKLTWYGIAIFDTIKKDKKIWFIVLFIATFLLNDLGILAMIYLILEKKPKKQKKTKKKKKR